MKLKFLTTKDGVLKNTIYFINKDGTAAGVITNLEEPTISLDELKARLKKGKKMNSAQLARKIELLNKTIRDANTTVVKLQEEHSKALKIETANESETSRINNTSGFMWKRSSGEVVDIRTDNVNNYHLVNILNVLLQRHSNAMRYNPYGVGDPDVIKLSPKVKFVIAEIKRRELVLSIKEQ